MKKSVLISFVLVALGAGVMAYARYATLSSDTVPVKIEQRLREKAQAGKAYCDKNGYNTNYCFLVDFSIHSGKRLAYFTESPLKSQTKKRFLPEGMLKSTRKQ